MSRSNVNISITLDDIQAYFSTIGKVLDCSITSKTALVVFKGDEDALKEKLLNREHEINGKVVQVALCKTEQRNMETEAKKSCEKLLNRKRGGIALDFLLFDN